MNTILPLMFYISLCYIENTLIMYNYYTVKLLIFDFSQYSKYHIYDVWSVTRILLFYIAELIYELRLNFLYLFFTSIYISVQSVLNGT